MLPAQMLLRLLQSAVLITLIAASLRHAVWAEEHWRPAHTVIVVLENRSAGEVYGQRAWSWLNALIAQGARMTASYFAQTPYTGLPQPGRVPHPTRPSQPNYLYLFSGSDQGVRPAWFRDPASPYRGIALAGASGEPLPFPLPGVRVGIGNDLIPASRRPFTTPNLGAAVIGGGETYASFVEGLPCPRWDQEFDPKPGSNYAEQDAGPDRYRRKHNPGINWVNLTGRAVAAGKRRFVLPVSTNLGFRNTRDPVSGRRYRGFAVGARGRALDYGKLPSVSLVIPDERHDGHSGSGREADEWLRRHIGPYADWARTHDSLLVITFDEDGATDNSYGDAYRRGMAPIPTVFFGPVARVLPGDYGERIDHLNVLATVLDRYGVLGQFRRDFLAAHAGKEAAAEYANLRPIVDIFGEGPPLGGVRERP